MNLPYTNQPRLLSFSLDSWPVLGDRVTLTLSDGVGVLVGRNGVGKSAILEGLDAISSFAAGFTRVRQIAEGSIPKVLDILVLTPTNRQLNYRYEIIPALASDEEEDIDDSNNENLEEPLFSWNERCNYIDDQKELLWTTETGVTTLYLDGNKSDEMILGSTNSLSRVRRPKSDRMRLPDEMEWILEVLRGIKIIGKVPVRQTFRRRPTLLRVSQRGIYSGGVFGLADSLARRILRLRDLDGLDELENVCQRIGIGNKIIIQKFVLSKENRRENDDDDNDDYVSSVLLDGVNIGLLFDGTLRVLSILIEIITLSPSATTIIEESEIQIHPGMLSKLLKEVEAYSFDENLIISTHSPQVVSWTTPEKINLVFREDGKTSVRKLCQDEIQKVIDYLCEEGDLGEWLYSGALEDE
jgi:hypothetical protein